MPDPSPLTQAARALVANQAQCDCYDDLLPEAQERARETVRAVLGALREPSDGMMEAAAETLGMKAASLAMTMHQVRGYGFDAGAFDEGSPLQQAWHAAIDKALAD